MSVEANIQTVKNFFAAIGSGDKPALHTLTAEQIEWIIPGEDWPLAGTHRGHTELAALVKQAADQIEIAYPEPLTFVAQGDRVMVIGFAQGTIQATAKSFDDHFVFAITVQEGRVTHIREYIDTQALARASEGAR